MSAPEQSRRTWLGALLPAAFVFIVLIGLGTWQVQRKAWKEALIAALTERTNAAPIALPVTRNWTRLDPAQDEYSRVIKDLTAEMDLAAANLQFETAAELRDLITEMKLKQSK